MAVDAVFDSVSVATTYKDKLAKWASSSAPSPRPCAEHPELVQKYLGSVVPQSDNFYAALNSAVFTDGSFVYIPKNTKCPMDLSTYFRINATNTGQFERTLIIADKGAYVSYLEGCTAPAARREPAARGGGGDGGPGQRDGSSTPPCRTGTRATPNGKGGIYNFVTKRGRSAKTARISWTQVETGSAVTWKYPSCILKGDNSVGEFYSVALTNNHQQADTGTKMIHLGKNTRARSSPRPSPPGTATTATAAW